MDIITFAHQHYDAFYIILSYLKTDDKQNLFFSNLQLQAALTNYKTMTRFINNFQTITFSFPQQNYDKQGNPIKKRHRTHISKTFNANATKIKCNTCNKYFYNAKHERSFNNCNRHPNYRWHNNKMYIAIIGKDKKGHKHTSKQHFLPESTYRQPVLCNTCRKFIYYNTTAKPINDRCSHCKFCGYCLWRNRQNISKVIVQTFNI